MNKQFVVCLSRNVDPLDTVYGPFSTFASAEKWLQDRGFEEEPEPFWEHRILELEPELPLDTLAEIDEYLKKAEGKS